ncbi:apolipoprotein N-acyltransferase [Halodesulfovibrio aestuarii]|uniref:apolipoprotein N-acyltransferase n=1 Tax=Halodesulfovibrio aestuarii TaxID=126333 RepID=UPI000429C2F8
MLQFAPLLAMSTAGLALGSANTIYQLPPLVLLYPACLYLLGLQAESGVIAFRRGLLAGTVAFSACLYWIAVPFAEQTAMPWYLAISGPVGVSFLLGIYSAVFSWCCYKFLRNAAPLYVGISTFFLWGTLELARGTLFSGFPWASLAAAFSDWPAYVQPVSVLGAEGYSALLAALACYITAALITSSVKHSVAALMSLALLFTSSYYSWIQPADADANIKIAMVQGNIDQGAKWNKRYMRGTVDRYITLSKQVLDHPVDLVIWPETSMPFYLQSSREYLPLIRSLAIASKAPYLIGTPGYATGTGGRKFDIFNRAYLIDSEGLMLSWYDKVHLVPFGEYVPFYIPFAEDLLQGTGTFEPGTKHDPISVGNLAMGVLICYEATFTELVQDRVERGANLLVNISNDAWFGKTAAPEQHLDMTILRAVEQGRYLARATNTGITAIIDPKGNITTKGKSFRADVVFGSVGTRTGFTFYHRFFSLIRALIIAGAIAVLAYSIYTNKKKEI